MDGGDALQMERCQSERHERRDAIARLERRGIRMAGADFADPA
jgi:hypothetical protein